MKIEINKDDEVSLISEGEVEGVQLERFLEELRNRNLGYYHGFTREGQKVVTLIVDVRDY